MNNKYKNTETFEEYSDKNKRSVDPEDDDDLFEMANLPTRRTGLPFVVWISPKGHAKHDVRVKVSQGPNIQKNELISVAIRPEIHVIGDGSQLSPRDFELLKKWITLNYETIIKYWDGNIEYTEDALTQLKSIST